MTGLNPESDQILEIATLITDADLNMIAEGPELVIHQDESRFALMDKWNQEHHTKSGLWEKALSSKVSITDAENLTLDFIKQHCKERESPLCGNSIWQDRRFVHRHMPRIDVFLHYRMIDVSTIKELAYRWYKDVELSKPKKESHRALDDIRESIAELRSYRHSVFK